MTKKNFWNDPEKGSIFFVSVEGWCLAVSSAAVASLVLPLGSAGRGGRVSESPLTSLSMPEPFSAIRDAAASRRRALGAVSRITANGGGIDVLRGSAAEGRGPPFPRPNPEVSAPAGRPSRQTPRTLLSTNAKKVTVSVLYWYE